MTTKYQNLYEIMKTRCKYLKNSLSDNITTGFIAGIIAALVNVRLFFGLQ